MPVEVADPGGVVRSALEPVPGGRELLDRLQPQPRFERPGD